MNEISEDESLKRVADSINIALEQTKNVIAVIENTAGQGNYLFEYKHGSLSHVLEEPMLDINLSIFEKLLMEFMINQELEFVLILAIPLVQVCNNILYSNNQLLISRL
jgi:hypothetical protein